MYVAKIVGNAVATRKLDDLVGKKLMLVRGLTPDNKLSEEVKVVVDFVGAGIGDIVLVSYKGNLAAPDKRLPIDEAIVGIVDSMELYDV